MATIVKCPAAKRGPSGRSRVADIVSAMPKMRPGQAVQWVGHPTGAHVVASTLNAYIGDAKYRAFKAADGNVYLTPNG